jgi:DNA-binding IclR family transcriptional regulator
MTTAPVVGSQTNATVERAADVLTLFARSEDPTLGVTEIAQALGLSKAAVHRILASLRSRSFVELDEETRRYSLGPASFELGLSYLARIDVRALAAPELAWLSRETQETATLSVLAGEGRIYVDQVTPPREIVMSVPLGQRFPLHAGSSSKAMLAFLPNDEVENYLHGQLRQFTETTRTDPDELRRDLAQIRSRGFATSAGERQAGAASVAAPVLDHSGRPVATMSVCGPAERLAAELDHAAALLLEAAARVSVRMGHRPKADT